MTLPPFINLIGYISSFLAMCGAFFVATTKPKLLILAFSLWLFTNAFELFVSLYYYQNYWMSFQFGFFFLNAIFGLFMWLRKRK